VYAFVITGGGFYNRNRETLRDSVCECMCMYVREIERQCVCETLRKR